MLSVNSVGGIRYLTDEISKDLEQTLCSAAPATSTSPFSQHHHRDRDHASCRRQP